jgi:O-methyltransferase
MDCGPLFSPCDQFHRIYMLTFPSNKIDLFKDVLTGACHPESAWVPLSTMAWNVDAPKHWRQKVQRAVYRWLDRRGWFLVKRVEFNAENRQNGVDWPLFGYTMVGRERLDNLQFCVESVLKEGIEGDFVETGVWRGGACMLMKAILQEAGDETRQVWVADSFSGLPPPTDESDGWDLSGHPHLTVPAAVVKENFRRFGLWDDRVCFLAGWFQETLATAPIQKLAVLRLDGDLYESTKVALDTLYDRVVENGFVIIDDYHAWPGCQRAVDEFRKLKKERGEMKEIDGTAVFWRKHC